MQASLSIKSAIGAAFPTAPSPPGDRLRQPQRALRTHPSASYIVIKADMDVSGRFEIIRIFNRIKTWLTGLRAAITAP
jgi:hypothetical protein